MTVSSSRTRRMNIDRMVLRAGQLAGVLDAEQPQTGAKWQQISSMARDFLQIIVDGLASEGVLARFMQYELLQLVAGTNEYTLPDYVMDVTGDAAYLPAGTSGEKVDGETIVKSIDRERYQSLSSKGTSSSQVMLYYPERAADDVVVYLWPTPSEAGRIRFQAVRHLSDTSDGNATLDLQVNWYEPVLEKLAYSLSKSSSLPADVRITQRADAESSKRQAKSVSHQRQSNRCVVAHRTAWSR